MSNTIPLPPLPEPVTLYHRPSFLAGDYIYITGHTPDQMHAHAAAVSVADNAALLKLNASQSVHIISQSDRIKLLEDALWEVHRMIGRGGGAYDINKRTAPVIRAALGDKT